MMISIAIDGPSGSGKSSISKVLAKKLGFISLDTGALYRTIAYFLKTRKINYEDENTVAQNLQDINMNLRYLNSNQRVFLNDKDVTNVIRSEEISMISSRISAMPCIRNYLLEFQRNMAKKHNIIMDGRDIGTVVLPNADVKIFLTASPEVRAKRRYLQLIESGEKAEYNAIVADVIKRDFNDTHRKISPLKQAKDAIFFDSSKYDFEQTVDNLLKIIKERIPREAK